MCIYIYSPCLDEQMIFSRTSSPWIHGLVANSKILGVS